MRADHARKLTRAGSALFAVSITVAAAGCGERESDRDLVAGKQLFVQKCGSCHILARAGTKGTQGPDLDQAFQQAQKEGFGETAIRGIIHKQIAFPARFDGGLRPDGSVAMPADLVTGDEAKDVASYVAKVVSKKGKDAGLLATAVKPAGAGKPVAAKDGILSIAADPGGLLAFVATKATAPAGPITLQSPNKSGVPHNIVIDGLGEGEVVENGVSEFEATLAAGEKYTYFCSVPGHREGGMAGELSVK